MKYIYKITTLVIISLLMQSCAVVGLVQSRKEYPGDYEVHLKPENDEGYYDMSINVIQGIASFEDGFFTTQTSMGKYFLINYLDNSGNSLYNHRFNIDSHGQDLSLEQVSENEVHLYTTIGRYNKDRASGIVRLIVTLPVKVNGVRDMSKVVITVDKEFDLKLRNSTPTINEEKTHFAIRTGNSIIVVKKEDVFKSDISNAITFDISKEQLSHDGKTLWFQGIAMKGDLVYCHTGNSSIDSPKYIYVYNLKGEVVKKHTIGHHDFTREIGHKFEPEGITFVGDDLYFLVMAKAGTGGNIKYLYKLNQE